MSRLLQHFAFVAILCFSANNRGFVDGDPAPHAGASPKSNVTIASAAATTINLPAQKPSSKTAIVTRTSKSIVLTTQKPQAALSDKTAARAVGTTSPTVMFPPSLKNIVPAQVHPPQLNDVKHLLEKEISNWHPKGKPLPVPSAPTVVVTPGKPHLHVEPEHPKSFANKQKKLSEKGWFHYNGKQYNKEIKVASTKVSNPVPLSKSETMHTAKNKVANHHVRHTMRASIADRGLVTPHQSSAVGSLVFIIVAGLAVVCAVGSLFTAA